MLHNAPGADEFDRKLQLSQLRYVTTSTAAADEPGRELRGARARVTREESRMQG